MHIFAFACVPGTVVLPVDVACRVCVNAKEDVSLSHNLLLEPGTCTRVPVV